MIYIFAGKDLRDPRVITNVDVPIEEIRDCGVDDERLVNVITESVKLVMDEVYNFVTLCF
jgi:arginase